MNQCSTNTIPLKKPYALRLSEAAMQLTQDFRLQSYFDDVLLERAILEQSTNDAIVDSTAQESQLPGYGFGLHPSSQTPIAVQVNKDPPFLLKPGQVLFPTGQRFESFRWGLPFGWLGGGVATLIVFQSKEATVYWGEGAEVLFHRVRIPILQPADVTALANNNARKNWPFRFPWTQALRGASSVPQRGKPVVAIAQPTRVAMALRGKVALAAAAPMRMVWQGTSDFAANALGVADMTVPPLFQNFVWPVYTSLGVSGNLSAQVPHFVYEGAIARLAADDGGVALIDGSGGAAALNACFVDFCRYGKL